MKLSFDSPEVVGLWSSQRVGGETTPGAVSPTSHWVHTQAHPPLCLPAGQQTQERTSMQKWKLFGLEKRYLRHDLVIVLLQPVEIYHWGWKSQRDCKI